MWNRTTGTTNWATGTWKKTRRFGCRFKRAQCCVVWFRDLLGFCSTPNYSVMWSATLLPIDNRTASVWPEGDPAIRQIYYFPKKLKQIKSSFFNQCTLFIEKFPGLVGFTLEREPKWWSNIHPRVDRERDVVEALGKQASERDVFEWMWTGLCLMVSTEHSQPCHSHESRTRVLDKSFHRNPWNLNWEAGHKAWILGGEAGHKAWIQGGKFANESIPDIIVYSLTAPPNLSTRCCHYTLKYNIGSNMWCYCCKPEILCSKLAVDNFLILLELKWRISWNCKRLFPKLTADETSPRSQGGVWHSTLSNVGGRHPPHTTPENKLTLSTTALPKEARRNTSKGGCPHPFMWAL